MAKVLQMPVAVKDVDGMVPYKKDDVTEEFEELEDYATPGADSIEGAIGKIDQIRAGGLEDPIQDFHLLQQRMQLQGMAGGEDFDLEDDGGLVELDDYPTPGAKSLEEATAEAKEAMASAKDMPSYAGYAAQVFGLEQMQGKQTTLKAEGEQVDIPDYQVALSGPKPGSKVLDAFKQQSSKILDKMPKFDELKETPSKTQEQDVQNPALKDLDKPTPAPSGKAIPVAESSHARALPDLSGLKTGGKASRALELD